MGSFLGVPVMVAREPFGNLYLTEKDGGGEFTAGDELMIRMAVKRCSRNKTHSGLSG